MQFTWDAKKSKANLRKHGISFEEAATVFSDPLEVIIHDDLYTDRMILIGFSGKQRLLLVVFVEFTEEDTTRIITARRATSHERRQYEKGDS